MTTAVTRYKAAGLRADYSLADMANGVVRIVFENPMMPDETLVVFDIHKVARPGWFGNKAPWVVQLASKPPYTDNIVKHGCVRGTTQAHAIPAAEIDLKHGFLSNSDFEMSAEAY